MHYDVIITKNMQILSIKLYFFSNINAISTAVFTSSFFFIIKCLQKDIIDVISLQLHFDIDIKYILNHFPLLKIMIIETTCLRVKGLNLYVIENACKLIKIRLFLLFKYKEFLFNKH